MTLVGFRHAHLVVTLQGRDKVWRQLMCPSDAINLQRFQVVFWPSDHGRDMCIGVVLPQFEHNRFALLIVTLLNAHAVLRFRIPFIDHSGQSKSLH